MDAVVALASVRAVQLCFQVIAALMLTAYMFPKQAVVTDQEEFDFIVVGAGAAGSVVAARLAESKFKVLLVEAGGNPPEESIMPGLLGFLPRTRNDWNYTNENDNYSFQCHRTRTANMTSGHLLGGGSSVNYMLYVRGCPGDYTSWEVAAQDPTWSWAGVLPYFIKSEKLNDADILSLPQGQYHGTDGFLGVERQEGKTVKYLESFAELGNDIILDINSNLHLGYTNPMLTITNGLRQSTATTILSAQKCDPNLHVLKDTFVSKILFDANNNAIGIEAIRNDNKTIELRARKEVVVSAGAISTPRLLMLSGIGPREHLQSLNISVRSNLPVGTNFQDHTIFMTSTTLENSTKPPPPINPHEYIFETFTGYVALNKSHTCPDYQTVNFIVPSDSDNILNLCVAYFGFDFDICQKFYDAGRGKRTLFTVLAPLHPKSRGKVLLRSTNPRDPPLIYGGYLSHEHDLETAVDSLIDFFKILDTPYFKSIDAEMVYLNLRMCNGLKHWSREWWRCYAKCLMNVYYHYSGTCALGSVVDSRLRVFGTRRLRVVDASIMPEVIGGNTNAPTIMIGEKAADFIKEDHMHADPSSSFYFVPYYQGSSWIKK